MAPAQPGGFIPALPSPAPSSASASSASRPHRLPHPRTRALAPGCSKEDMVRRFAEDKLADISRRYVKKFSDEAGFRTFGEVAKELDGVVNVLWKSGTPSLQIPFLLKLASDFTQYVRSFPPSPRATFELLRKLDHCFASLLRGQDVDTCETLPGFENGLARAGMTTTDMVRCRSLVGQTRFLMVELMSMGEMDDEDEDEDEDEGEDEGDDTGDDEMGEDRDGEEKGAEGSAGWDVDEDERVHLDAARVYQHTIIQLESRLGNALGTASGSIEGEVDIEAQGPSCG
ncbi:hypothetical protein ESCO_005742 [Escovopsis weberi]|uniref:Meiotic recombination protein DMC1 n=1 Tax=Escovopsis weberi TaxID=150374 RepID=A0A0M8MWE7_ESCWE|nr:hypothetical protein ESCO_005742 [Escovopsis weberi]